MMAFADRTGLVSRRPQRRYLWTDAFAVCNFLGLSRESGEGRYEQLARALVDVVHRTLGRHRQDDPRRGWLSGLGELEGAKHPTRGGLRIGKELPERGPHEPFDPRLEWERDGQYFHYLTKWMLALDLLARTTHEARFNLWARELARAAREAFTYETAGSSAGRMYWKLSIDLTRPLVASMGLHDPLDGFVTCLQLQATADELPSEVGGPDLGEDITVFAAMARDGDWTTADPLGLGGLLVDAYRIAQLRHRSEIARGEIANDALLERLLAAAREGMDGYERGAELERPAGTRLAFRELGLAIGLHAVERLWAEIEQPRVRSWVEPLFRHAPMLGRIEAFWLEPAHRAVETWSEHRDINEVMLATSLAPEGVLVLPSMRGRKNI